MTTLYHLNSHNKLAICTASVKPCPFKVHMTAEQWDVVGRQVPKTREQQWAEQFEALSAFVSEHDRLPQQLTKAEAALYQWLRTQRAKAARGDLTQEQIDLLSKIPGWNEPSGHGNSSGSRISWQENLDSYAAFRQQHGRDPQRNTGDVQETKLSTWLANQRQAVRGLNPSQPISQERIDALTAINSQWQEKMREHGLSGPHVPWETRYEQLATWLTQHETMPRVNVEDEHEKKLGMWLLNQKHGANGKGTVVMTAEHLEQLNALDPNWLTTTYRDDAPKLMLEELRTYVKEHGVAPRYNAPKGSQELRLYSWLVKRRRESEDAEERHQIEQLAPRQPRGRKPSGTNSKEGGREKANAARLQQLRDFVAEHGHAPLSSSPSSDPEEISLYRWVRTRRIAADISLLELVQIEELAPRQPRGRRPSPAKSGPKPPTKNELRMQQLETFVAESRRGPRAISNATGGMEGTLYRWVKKRRAESTDFDELARLEELAPLRTSGRPPKYISDLADF